MDALKTLAAIVVLALGDLLLAAAVLAVAGTVFEHYGFVASAVVAVGGIAGASYLLARVISAMVGRWF